MITTERPTTSENAASQQWGMRIRHAREALNLSEKDAAARLHLKPYIINIIENELFQEGPPAIFMRGYIRSYGKMLNLSEKDLNQALLQFNLSNPATQPPVPAFKMRKPLTYDGSSRWATSLVVVMLTGLVGIWWWNSHTRAVNANDFTNAVPIGAESTLTHATATSPAAETNLNPAADNPPANVGALAAATPPAETLAQSATPTAPAAAATSAPLVDKTLPLPTNTTPAQPTTTVAPPNGVGPAPLEAPTSQASTLPAGDATPAAQDQAATPVIANAEPTNNAATPTPAATTPTMASKPTVKKNNLADAPMAVPEEGLDNEPSE